jgi:serine/threonine protein kinase
MEGCEALEERFRREVEALQRCKNPSIAKIVDVRRVVVASRNYWLFMEEYIDGGSLVGRFLGKGLSLADVLLIGRGVAGAIAHLRELRIVHRDIKPANILISLEERKPFLTDFGIARILDASTLTKDFLAQGPGTPFYAAPEQLKNEKHLIDWRTDQFGLAVTLACCLLERHPFRPDGSSDHDAIVRVASRLEIDDGTSAQLTHLGFGFLLKALQPWPINRYRRPEDFVDAFV